MSLTSYFYDTFSEPFLDFNRLFEAPWDARWANLNRDVQRRDDPSAVTSVIRPKMDLHESKETDQLTATFELPGMKKENVNIDIRDNRLVVSGQCCISDALNQDGYTVRERRFGKFSRALPLPTGIKPENIKASMENGVLTVQFPKSHPDQEPKKITIS